MRGTKRSHRSLRKASTDVHKSRTWPVDLALQLLRASQEVAKPVIKVITAVPSRWKVLKSRAKIVSYSHIASSEYENNGKTHISDYFYSDYKIQLLSSLNYMSCQ